MDEITKARQEKRRIIFKRLRLISYRYNTTVEHMLAVMVALAFPTIEKLTPEEFRDEFGQGRAKRAFEARKDRRRVGKMEKHVAIARKREDRVMAKVQARGSSGSNGSSTKGSST